MNKQNKNYNDKISRVRIYSQILFNKLHSWQEAPSNRHSLSKYSSHFHINLRSKPINYGKAQGWPGKTTERVKLKIQHNKEFKKTVRPKYKFKQHTKQQFLITSIKPVYFPASKPTVCIAPPSPTSTQIQTQILKQFIYQKPKKDSLDELEQMLISAGQNIRNCETNAKESKEIMKYLQHEMNQYLQQRKDKRKQGECARRVTWNFDDADQI